MELVEAVFILLAASYSFSFAKFNWDRKNKMGSVGVIILTVISIALPAIIMLMK